MAGKISYNFAKFGPFSNGIRNPKKKHLKYTKFRVCEMSQTPQQSVTHRIVYTENWQLKVLIRGVANRIVLEEAGSLFSIRNISILNYYPYMSTDYQRPPPPPPPGLDKDLERRGSVLSSSEKLSMRPFKGCHLWTVGDSFPRFDSYSLPTPFLLLLFSLWLELKFGLCVRCFKQFGRQVRQVRQVKQLRQVRQLGKAGKEGMEGLIMHSWNQL